MSKPNKLTAMISSTMIDLPEHRKEVINACLRESIFPRAMEHLPARDADAIKVSMEMVDEADIYIGIYAWRYGHIPEGQTVSVTEMEFNRAVERKIPILVFLIHKDHLLTIEMVETREDAQKKLAALKERASKGRGRREFKSSEGLRGEVIHALSDLKQREEDVSGTKSATDFHPPNIIPKSPEPYIAHPYSLLQTKDVIGRQRELNLLTDWVTANKHVPADTRIFNLVAIGGMGKSALTWKWFNDIVPNEMPQLAGRMWWSFYESDAHYENFIIRALAYVSGQCEKNVREMKSPDREDQLLRILDQQPFLLVLDGLERILLAYARMDAARMLDEDLDEQTANRIAKVHGLPESAGESFIAKHQLRCTVDHRAGQFLRRLARIKLSHILITTRLYPAELQTETGEPLPSCSALFLIGLEDDDALNLWREFKVSGSREQMLPLFNSFGNYPLLLRALAGEVASFRDAPGDFDKWRQAYPRFDTAGLALKNVKTHVLEYALRGLGETERKVLHTLGAFRMPATWDTLRALLVGQQSGFPPDPSRDQKGLNDITENTPLKPCPDDSALDTVLTRLEDRGLVGWDKLANRYDLHPIIRSVVWHALEGQTQREIYQDLHAYFDAIPKINEENVERLEDLTPTIELYHTLIGLDRFNDAFMVFRDNLESPLQFRLSANRIRVHLLEQMFPDGIQGVPRLTSRSNQIHTINALAVSYLLRGEPGRSIDLFVRCFQAIEVNKKNAAVISANLSNAYRLCGFIYKAEVSGLKALRLSRIAGDTFQEIINLQCLGLAWATAGKTLQSQIAMRRALNYCRRWKGDQIDGLTHAFFAQCALWFNELNTALRSIKISLKIAKMGHLEGDYIRAARIYGTVALSLGDVPTSLDLLHQAIERSRKVSFIEEELPAISVLAECHRQKSEFSIARELLEQVWLQTARGPYPLLHADALNILTQIERGQNSRDAAIILATKAYTLSWCDGPPYVYHYGLTNARRHLQELGAPEPKLPPFDESNFEPMPEVELNPKDEFWVDPDKLDSLD